MEIFDLTGKKAMVTGSSKGIGQAMAEGLHEAGAELVLISSTDRVYDTAKKMGASGAPVHAVKANLADRQELDRGFDEALTALNGELDILLNCAGIHKKGPSIDYDIADWDRILNLNLSSVFLLCQRAARVMIPRGYGKIINISSANATSIGSFNAAAYCASKGGMISLSKTLSNEWAGKGICVNCIAPTVFRTDLTADTWANRREEYIARIPKGRWGDPPDLKGPAVFLASPASDFITGIVLPVDGGLLAK